MAGTYHQGRLFDHVHLRVSRLEITKVFYRAVLTSLGLGEAIGETDDCFYCDELYIDEADGICSNVHLAFQARNRADVDAFHAAALTAGGECNGPPGLRDYHGRYYAAYVLDPDGNNIEAVCDAPVIRSATSIEVTRES